MNITADPATNAMVVSASPQDWQTLKQIVDDLDTPRVQIFVQAVIVEVSAERQRELGVNFNAATSISGSTLGVGTLNFGQLESTLGDPLGLTGLGLGLASKSMCSVPSALASAPPRPSPQRPPPALTSASPATSRCSPRLKPTLTPTCCRRRRC